MRLSRQNERFLIGQSRTFLTAGNPDRASDQWMWTPGLARDRHIALQNRATGAAREQVTDIKGLYQFEVLPPGEYELTVEAVGFKQFRDSRVRIQVAQISRLNVQLEVGSNSEFIEVQDTVSPLSTESVAQGAIVGEQKIAHLGFSAARAGIGVALVLPWWPTL